MSASSEYVGGLDAMREIERQISLTVNNLANQFSHILSSDEVTKQLSNVFELRFKESNGSFWVIEFEEDRKLKSFTYCYRYDRNREALEYLKWTKETKGEPKVKNYLWMRIAHRPEVLMICHKALDALVSGFGSRFSELGEHIAQVAALHKYALEFRK